MQFPLLSVTIEGDRILSSEESKKDRQDHGFGDFLLKYRFD